MSNPSTSTKPAKKPSALREWLHLAGLLLLMLAARDSLANHYLVPSGSMEPTLVPGDRVVVDMRAYGWRIPFTSREWMDGQAPAAGDVVVFDSPIDGTRLIKRVVAVAGDTVALQAGRLYRNGRWLADSEWGDVEQFNASLKVSLNLKNGGGDDIAPMTIPLGKALVLGDHRGNSADGRYFGLVDADSLYGKAVGVFYRSSKGLVWKAL